MNSLIYRILEFNFIFVGFPLIFLFKLVPIYLIIPTVWLVCIYTFYIIKKNNRKILFDLFELKEFIEVVKRFIVSGILLFIITYVFFEDKLFSFALTSRNDSITRSIGSGWSCS